MSSECVRKEVEALKALVYNNQCDLKENQILYYELNRNIVVSLGKEINRDTVSSGERTQSSLVIAKIVQLNILERIICTCIP
jgi:hypothetical protein